MRRMPVPDKDLPVVLPEDWCRMAPATRSTRPPSFVNVKCPEVGRPARTRNGHHGHLRRFVLVLPALRLPGAERHGGRARQLLAAGRPVHRRHGARHPAPAVFALLDQGDARPRAREVDEPFRNLLTQGMVLHHIYYREPDAGRVDYYNPAESKS